MGRSKIRRHSLAFLLAASLFSVSARSEASPWAEVGDRQLRSDIEILESYRLVDGVISGWPIPWAQVARALSEPSASLPPHVRQSIARLRARFDRETAQKRWKPEVELRLTSEPPLVREFGRQPRQEIDARASAEYMWASTALRLAAGLQSDIDFSDAHPALDGSYVAQELGNWLFYAGYLDHWWGGGWMSSMILSSNARPFPRVGVMRNDPKAFETPWLSWIGPWQVNAFLGLLEDSGRAVDDPFVFGLRLAVNPLPGLELAGARTFQICGEDRPCGTGTWWDALRGVDNTPGPGDPSNQLGGFEARYSNHVGPVGFSLYAQYIGEDEAGGLPSRAAGLAGASVSGPAGSGGAQWRVVGEYSDSAASVLSRRKRFNLTYEHGTYATGYRYRDRAIAHSLDNDAKLYSLGAWLTDVRDRTYRLAYHHAKLNRDDVARGNTVSATAENVNVVEAGLEIPWGRSTFDMTLRFQDDQPETPGRKDAEFSVDAAWRLRF